MIQVRRLAFKQTKLVVDLEINLHLDDFGIALPNQWKT